MTRRAPSCRFAGQPARRGEPERCAGELPFGSTSTGLRALARPRAWPGLRASPAAGTFRPFRPFSHFIPFSAPFLTRLSPVLFMAIFPARRHPGEPLILHRDTATGVQLNG